MESNHKGRGNSDLEKREIERFEIFETLQRGSMLTTNSNHNALKQWTKELIHGGDKKTLLFF